MRVSQDYTIKDTLYIMFNEIENGMRKHKSYMYTDHDPKYYWIDYKIPVYWKEKKTGDFEDSYLFDDYYNHMFWYGTYKKNLEFLSEIDDSEIYGNSIILKKHKSFIKRNKYRVIDFRWLKKMEPQRVNNILKPDKRKLDKPTLFLIDKSEFFGDSIVLRNVIYHRQIIE